MKKASKRITQARQKLETKVYTVEEAITLLQELATANFIESAEAHVALNIEPKYSDQQVRSTFLLPHGSGKEKRIAVLLPNEKRTTEIENAADIVGSEALIQSITNGELNFDILLATPEMMPKLAKLGRILGPKGLMPSPKAGTVTSNIMVALEEFKKGKLEYRADKTGIVHISFGKVNFSIAQLIENVIAFYRSVEQNKPSGVKGRYFKTFVICSTMGPSIQVDLLSLQKI